MVNSPGKRRRSTLVSVFLLVLIASNVVLFSTVFWRSISLGVDVPSSSWMNGDQKLQLVSRVKFLYDNYDAPPPASMADLLSRPVFLPTQSSTLPEARANFRLRYQRDPPSAFNAWFMYARDHQCVIDNYDFINHDFAPFRDTKVRNGGAKPITRALIRATSRIGRMHAITLNDNKVQISPAIWYGDRLQRHFVDFHKIIPHARITIAHNSLSEPRVITNNPYQLPTFYARLPAPTSSSSLSDAAHPTPNLSKRRSTPKKIPDLPLVTDKSGVTDAGVKYASKKGFDFMKTRCPFHPLLKNYTEEDPRVDHSFFGWGNGIRVTENIAPVAGQARIHGCYHDLQWASHYIMTDPFMSEIDNEERPAWEEKREVLFWRGSTTGQENMLWNWRDNHRVKAWELTRKLQKKYVNRTIIDFELTSFVQSTNAAIKEMEIYLGAPAERVSRSDHWKNKYLLVLDGNVFASRLPHYLYGGSLVFLSSIFQHTFEEWLTPWVHYVPVRPDLSNLEERLRWAWENDDMAKKIAENGRAFAKRYIRHDDLRCWTYRMLIEYADLYDDDSDRA